MKRIRIIIIVATLLLIGVFTIQLGNNFVSGQSQYGLFGKSPGDGSGYHGVYGETTGDWGWASGVFGKAFRDNAIGVTGWHAGGGPGVYGLSHTGPGVVAKSKSGNLIEGWDTEPSERRFVVTNEGQVYADGNFRSGGADLAEILPATEGLEPSDVLVIGPDGKLARSISPYATNVVGVYSTKPGFIAGDDGSGDLTGKVPLAVLGIVPVKASVENGPIHPGSLLVNSSTAGYAMQAGTNPPVGSVIGKAMEALNEDKGTIKMLVILN